MDDRDYYSSEESVIRSPFEEEEEKLKSISQIYYDQHILTPKQRNFKYESSINYCSKDSSDLESQPEIVNESRLFSRLFSKKVDPIPTYEERIEYPWKKSNLFKRMGFWWLWVILKKGYKRTLYPEDLFKLSKDLTIEELYKKWEDNLNRIIINQQKKYHSKHGNLDDFEWSSWFIPFALFKTFKSEYILSAICLACAFTVTALSPLLTKEIIDFVEFKYFGIYTTYNRGIGFVIASVFLISINGLLLNHFFHNSMICGAISKGILTKALFLKSFNLSSETKSKFPIGKVTSIMSTDLTRIDLAIGFSPLIFCFPIPVIISIVILIVNLGAPALTGIGLFIVSLIICVLATKKLFTTRDKLVKFTDTRISLMREILQNLKIIKFYSWELAYKLKISKARESEMGYLFTIKVLRNFITAYAVTLPVLTSMISFITLWKTNSMGAPGKVFSSLSLYSILAQAIMLLPIALASGVDALIGITRCTEYISSTEYTQELHENLKSYDNQFWIGYEPEYALKVTNGNFNWSNDSNTQVDSSSVDTLTSSNSNEFTGLHNINLAVRNGEFVIITGLIGSGKSSLLQALSGNARNSESIKIYKKLLSCCEIWVQNATIKENVLFGQEYDEEKYKKVIHACALEDDLQNFTAGDETEIGERGITLSGGQKARINLARAVYKDSDIYLFDDVISAVDSRVGKHIIENLFKKYLKGKTIILATHQLSILKYADQLVFINKCGTIDTGSISTLSGNPEFKELMDHNENSNEEINQEEVYDSSDLETSLNNGKLIIDEERSINAISWKIYKKYIELGSGIFGKFSIPLLFVIIIIATFFQVFTNTWLSFWVERKFSNMSDNVYVSIYVILSFLTVIFTGVEFSMLAYMQNCSAKTLNVKAVAKILHAPMSFMDQTPIGRVLNRFTKDTDSLDNEIGEQMRLFIFPLALIIGILILCICYLPWFAIAIPFLGFGFVFLGNFYTASSREIKRLEAIARSSVYQNFNETLTGMTTIKNFNNQYNFISKMNRNINKMNEAYFLSIATQRWLCVHLDFINASFALIISIMCVTGQFNISASSTGLLLNYVIQLVGLLSLSVRAMTAVETEMNSVERLYEYAFKLPQESPYVIEEMKPQEDWPSSGYIQFQNVNLKYRDNLPYVLKNLNFSIYPGEKIGICGRTGAGKSSIMTALYRLVEFQGKIEIDGVDISKLGLNDLRSKLSIIPQDPILFLGTIRKNLDPFDEYDDLKLANSLKIAGLIEEDIDEYLSNLSHKFHLDKLVEDEGLNFSLGEKQLIALSRALIKQSKVLILDEATSSVDFITDLKIQNTINKEFKNCTILCIAHRLKTIVNYDRIFVMDKGEVIEKGKPINLFNENGVFKSMCDKANLSINDFS
ncbi:unnamed protein product [Candida verbasci]|uniref:Oligomycin resistance ATP-dependent permease YOR1 n=1 Tax=Candida verbasci TaxID=1227364 RepID=A0A9W4TY64_9ASCO|nr:unnamed protein product [Candida verbasci]